MLELFAYSKPLNAVSRCTGSSPFRPMTAQYEQFFTRHLLFVVSWYRVLLIVYSLLFAPSFFCVPFDWPKFVPSRVVFLANFVPDQVD